MVTESEKRAAKLAVSRYGASGARIKETLRSVLLAQAQGHAVDFLTTLVTEKLLTASQADELRLLALDTTQFDLVAAHPGVSTASATAKGGESGSSRPLRPAPAAEAPPAGPGTELRVLGEYRILRRLGEGGMGAVYLAYAEKDKRQVALKILNEQLSSIQASVDRFYREAKSGALLDHPNIVRNITVGQDRLTGKHYLVLEFVDGPSAHALLDRFGRLPYGDAVHIVLDVARALEHAHSRNIVHRDIKPDNILITQSGVTKLADLGLAKRTDEASHLTAARQGFGTPYYMPYEQAMNAKSVDGRSDIYALGATLYHLLTGEVPFSGATHLEVVEKKNLGLFTPASVLDPSIPDELDRILDKMLARDPRDRYQTASELIVDLERSNLAAAVPSFVDPDRALQDPVVRARLAAPAQPTCPDLERAVKTEEAPVVNGNPDLWYLRYRNRAGQWCKAKATTRQVLQRLREGRMPGQVEASHHPQDQFQPLAAISEFSEAAASPLKRRKALRPVRPAKQPGPAAPPADPDLSDEDSPRWSRWLPLAGVGLGLVLAAALVGLLVALAR